MGPNPLQNRSIVFAKTPGYITGRLGIVPPCGDFQGRWVKLGRNGFKHRIDPGAENLDVLIEKLTAVLGGSNGDARADIAPCALVETPLRIDGLKFSC